MLSHLLFDRVASPALFYTTVICGLLCIRHVIPFVLTSSSIILLSLLFSKSILYAVRTEYKIDSLGKRAPSWRTYTPFNLRFLFEALRYLAKHRNHELWQRLFKEAGNPSNPFTVEAIVLNSRLTFTADEENIKAILATQFQDFGKGPEFRKAWGDFLGLSIFTTDGELWHNSRQLLRPQFVKDRVSDLHTFEKHSQILLPMLAGAHEGATVHADDLFHRFALDVATDFLLGASTASLVNGQTEFAEAFAEVQRVQAVASRSGPLQSLMSKGSFKRSLAIINNFIEQYISKTLQIPSDQLEEITKCDERYTFLHELASHTRDRKVLRDQIIAVLLAGRDTTASTLSWLIYELSRHPEVVRELVQEIVDVVGLNRDPTYADLKSMRYLQHTLNETLRLYPVLPYNFRVALQDTTLPHGGGADGNEPIGILKDTEVAYSTLMMQRRPDIYPPTSEKFPHYLDFAPERWKHWKPKPWTYLPFNGGPRICIGQQFALTEMAYVLVRILQTYETIECRQDQFPGFQTNIVLEPANGVQVAFHARQ